MTDVENSEITLHREKFQISPEHRYFFLQFTLFCHESVLSQCVEKKLQISCMGRIGLKVSRVTYPLVREKQREILFL